MNKSAYEEAVLKGIERANKEMNQTKRTIPLKKVMPIAASIGMVGVIGLSQPKVAKALQEITQSFDAFSAHLFGEPTGRFQEVAKMIGVSQTDQDSTITLDEVILDDNLLMMALTVESEFLAGYENLNENDFFNLDYYLFINGKEASVSGSKIRQIDETTGAIIIEAWVSDLNLKEEANIDLRISHVTRGWESLKGKWNFNFKATKLSGGEYLNPQVSTVYKDSTISVEQVTKSQLSNTIEMKIEGAIAEEVYHQLGEFIIKGSNDQIYYVDSRGGSFDSSKKEYLIQLRVDSNWSSLEWIDIYPRTTEAYSYTIKDGIYHALYQTPKSSALYEGHQIINRKPTKEELAAGYALDEVIYYVNLTEQTEFKKLDQFVGDEIWVNSTEKVVIEDVELNHDKVKILFKLPSSYSPSNLSSKVLFDEMLNDYARREGQLVLATEDEEVGLYSVTLDDIDLSKNYTLAIPLMPELSEEAPEWRLRIPLK